VIKGIKPILLIFIFGVTYFDILAQTPNWSWANSAGGNNYDVANCVTTDINGNTIVTGYFYSDSITFGTTTLMNPGGSIFIVKYDTSGTVLWAKSAVGIGGSGKSITSDLNGNVFVTGFFANTITFGTITLTSITGTLDVFIVKFDSAGNVLWAKSGAGVDADNVFSVATDNYGNIIITGEFLGNSITFGSTTLFNTSVGSTDMFLVKYDSSGNVLWARSADGNDWDSGYGVSSDSLGNIFVTGYFLSSTITFGSVTISNLGSYTIFLVKYDSSGNAVWAKAPSGFGEGYGNGITTYRNENIYVTGQFEGILTFGTITLNSFGVFGDDLFIVKYDSSGNVLWAHSAGGNWDDVSTSITTDNSGNAFVTGYYYSDSITFDSSTFFNNNGSGNILIAKYDSTGNLNWAATAGGIADDEARSIRADGNGRVYVAGYFTSPNLNFGTLILINNGYPDVFISRLEDVNTGTSELNSHNWFNIFPNPATNTIQLTFSTKEQAVQCEIINILGEKVLASPLTPLPRREELATAQLDVSILAKGIYLVKVSDGKSFESKKLVIE